MRRLAPSLLVLLVACSGDGDTLAQPSPTPVEVEHRVISEEQNAAFCVEGPEFEVVRTDEEWVAVYSRQSDCQPGGEFTLPRVRFDHPSEPEAVLAAWWKVEGCLGYDVTTRRVVRAGAEVTVVAETSGPGEGDVCATALGGLESFLAIPASTLDGVSVVRFELDGDEAGAVELTPEG